MDLMERLPFGAVTAYDHQVSIVHKKHKDSDPEEGEKPDAVCSWGKAVFKTHSHSLVTISFTFCQNVMQPPGFSFMILYTLREMIRGRVFIMFYPSEWRHEAGFSLL